MDILSHRKIEITVIGICVLMIMLTITMNENKGKPVTLHTIPSSDSSHVDKVTIDIKGAIHRPGIYVLLSSQRLHDAIKAAGGLSAQADTSYIDRELNLASYLHDQDKIYIPHTGEKLVDPTSSISISIALKSISLNAATVNEIDGIPGIGKTTALKIIQNRPYSSLKELLSKKVVSSAIYKKIEKYIHL